MWKDLWFNAEVSNTIRRLINSGAVRFNIQTKLLEPVTQGEFDTNWLFTGNTIGERDCFLWHHIMFNHFNLVPEFCKLHCHKVVIKPRNVVELIRVHGLFNAIPLLYGFITPMQSKCGIDTRNYTDCKYSGYIYCSSLEEGREKHAILRKACAEHLEDGENIPIILKRSCTEFEKKYGPTDGEFWEAVTPVERDLEKRLGDIFSKTQTASIQPDWLKNKTIYYWIEHANAIGDRSWVELFGEDPITMSAVTYHEGGDKTIKSAKPLAKAIKTKPKLE